MASGASSASEDANARAGGPVTADAPAHALVEFAALLGKPLLVRAFAADLRLAIAEGTEVIIRLDFVLQLARHQLDHDGVVEEAEAGCRVGNQVLRLGEVRDGGKHTLAFRAGEIP